MKIAFTIPLGPGKAIDRFVYAYIIEGERLCLIDTGVAGAEREISAAVRTLGRDISDIGTIILTHSHPDHLGAASLIKRRSGARVLAHGNERVWIEDTDRQGRERPVPGFAQLVSGPVAVDRLLGDGDTVSLGDGMTLAVLHTPGHSAGSISLLSPEDGALFCGDVVPQQGEMPIYEDVITLAHSLVRLGRIENLHALYSSWADPRFGRDALEAVRAGARYLKTVQDLVLAIDSELGTPEPMALCARCVERLGLPPFAINPLVARTLAAHRADAARRGLDAILSPILA